MSNFDILQGDVMDQLRTLSDASVHCCVTSPPYFGLRSYGVDGQIGLEKTSAEYIAKLVAVFGDVRRVLRGDGQLWLNLGDSYSGAHYSNQANTGGAKREQGGKQSHTPTSTIGMKPKDLMMIPARVAIALQDDGWWLRSVIIWNKLNPMPESVTDRPTTAHEYIFLLTKAERYFYDAAAVAEPVAASTVGRGPVSFGGAKGRAYEPEPTDPNYRGGNEQWGAPMNIRAAHAINARSGLWQPSRSLKATLRYFRQRYPAAPSSPERLSMAVVLSVGHRGGGA